MRDLYDILYGNRYCYNGTDQYPATDLQMGIEQTDLYKYRTNSDGSISLFGKNFTNWSKIYVNDEKTSTIFVSDRQVDLPADAAKELKDGDIFKVCQIGSNRTVFRTTERFLVYHALLEVL